MLLRELLALLELAMLVVRVQLLQEMLPEQFYLQIQLRMIIIFLIQMQQERKFKFQSPRMVQLLVNSLNT